MDTKETSNNTQSNLIGKLFQQFKLRQKLSFRKIFTISLSSVIIGTWLSVNAFAATQQVANVLADQMTLPRGSSIVSDSSSSTGQVVRMTRSGSSLTGSVNLPSNATSLSVYAEGTKCQRGWPNMQVSIDNKRVISNVSVNSSSWQSYNANDSLSSGTHSISITDNANDSCQYLSIDHIAFFGSSSTPVPTVTINASPSSVSSGGTSTLSWNSTNATSCTASGAWSGNEPTSGSQATGALTSTSTYNLSCTGSGGSANSSTTVTVTSSSLTCQSVAIPAYFYPSGGSSNPWTQASADEPGVGIMIANVNSGPGTSPDPNYVAAINNSEAAGIKVFGYVYTSYGSRSTSAVETDINAWKSMYNVSNIFLDETATSSTNEPYYQNLTSYVHSMTTGSKTMLNPGTVPDQSYMNAGDIINVFEDSYSNYQSASFPSWMHNYSPNRFYVIVYDVPSQSSMTSTLSSLKNNGIGYVYVTNDNLPNPYDTIPPYLSSEASTSNGNCF